MQPVQQALTIPLNTTFDEFTVVWKDENDAAIDITSYTARMSILSQHNTTPVLTITSSASAPNSRIVKTNAEGKCQIVIVASDTASLSPGDYVYEMILVNGTEVRRLVKGVITFTPFITAVS